MVIYICVLATLLWDPSSSADESNIAHMQQFESISLKIEFSGDWRAANLRVDKIHGGLGETHGEKRGAVNNTFIQSVQYLSGGCLTLPISEFSTLPWLSPMVASLALTASISVVET